MENTEQKLSKTNLDELPASSDSDFWLEAEIHTNLTPEEVNKSGEHYFIRTTGRQAQCQHCDWGFELDPGDKIIDGHLYDKKGTLII
jgi:hypothetical protein